MLIWGLNIHFKAWSISLSVIIILSETPLNQTNFPSQVDDS